MITEIGIVAGEIWQYLDKNGNANVEQLAQATKRDKELVLMSLGWLGREGHVQLGAPETGYEATLIKSETD